MFNLYYLYVVCKQKLFSIIIWVIHLNANKILYLLEFQATLKRDTDNIDIFVHKYVYE